MNRPKIPLIGGTLTISLVEKRCTPKAGGGPLRSPKDRLLASIQKDSKLNGSAPSDEVENFKFEVKWEPMKGALGVHLTPELERSEDGEFDVVRTVQCHALIISDALMCFAESTRPEF